MRTSRAILSFSSGLAFMALTLVLSVTTTPILLELLGDERVGAFRALTDWASNVLILELILSTSLLGMFSKSVSESKQSLEAVFSAAAVGYRYVAIGSIAFSLLAYSQIEKMVPVPQELVAELKWAWLVLLLSGLVVLLGPIRPYLEAQQRSYSVSLVLALQSITITAVSILCAWFGWGIPGQAMGSLAGTAVLATGLLLALNRFGKGLPWRLIVPKATGTELRRLVNLQWPSVGLRVSGQLGMMSDNIVVGIMLGPAAVVPFVLTQRIPQVVQMILQMVGSSTWAGFAEIYHTGQKLLLSKRVIEVTKLLSILGAAFFGPVIVFNERFIEIWVGETRYGGLELTLLACANIFFLAFGTFWGYLFVGTGKMKEVAGIGITSGVFNLILSILATWYLGILGPLVGSLVSQICITFPAYVILLRKHFDVSSRRLIMACFLPFAPAIPIIGFAFQLARLNKPGLFVLGLEAALLCCVVVVLQWCLVLSTENRNDLKLRFIAIMPIKT